MSTNNNACVDSSVRQHLASINISEEEIFDLNSLDPDKSSGIDTIGPRVGKKMCSFSVWTNASSICNKPQQTHHNIGLVYSCYHPCTQVWRQSLVSNYRPISLLSNTSKVLEQLIYNKVIHHISNFLTPKQFGFL